jgi:hypothetical protein
MCLKTRAGGQMIQPTSWRLATVVRSTLGWRTHFNDLEAIVTHALARERKLARRGL